MLSANQISEAIEVEGQENVKNHCCNDFLERAGAKCVGCGELWPCEAGLENNA